MKIGTKLVSQVCPGEIIIIRAEGIESPPEAGGQPMLAKREHDVVESVTGDGFQLGKRYELIDESRGIRVEVMVTKPGTSSLTWNGEALQLKATKPLPASD